MTGSPDGYLDWPTGRTDQENRAHAVTVTGRLAGSSRTPGSRVIAFATWLLALLGAGLMYVSFDAQYQFILAQKDARAASLIEAAMLDAGMVILSALGIGLARAGKPSGSVRFLIMICAGASAGMNFAAADPGSWRSVVAYVSAPVFLAVITDRVIAVIRQHVLPPDAESAWVPLGRAGLAVLRLVAVVGLYLLRTVLAPSGTLRGLRQMVLDAAPVPGTIRAGRPRGEPLPRPDHDHQIPEHGSGRPSEDTGAVEADGRDGDQGLRSARDRVLHQEGCFPGPLPGSLRVREPVSYRAGRCRARTASRPAGWHWAHLHRRGAAQAHRPGRYPTDGRGR
jgi:hypothetical protein